MPERVARVSSPVTAHPGGDRASRRHSAGAWLYATCLMEQIPLAAFPLMIWASGVSLSRVIVGVHYPLDVVLGAAMGVACGQEKYIDQALHGLAGDDVTGGFNQAALL